MRTFELTDHKVITDLCLKFQFQKSSLVPIFVEDQDEEYLKNLNFAKLHEQLMKEQADLEKSVRQGKSRKLLKW